MIFTINFLRFQYGNWKYNHAKSKERKLLVSMAYASMGNWYLIVLVFPHVFHWLLDVIGDYIRKEIKK